MKGKKHFVVFVCGANNKIVELPYAFNPQNKHLEDFFTSVVFHKKEHKVLVWGRCMYVPHYINQPILVKGNYYQVVEMRLFGHYFITETSEDSGNNYETIDCSGSYLDYDECYNAMKLEAMKNLASSIDIKQDFDEGTEFYKSLVEFRENQIEVVCENNHTANRYRIF